ncbi:hypothetical protein AB4156_31915 [Cupriavidus sp. 2MCAB6]|uniref:hypothetical protein n=1 Tax=Cupriavidus sp. 2MCAB6 TaxID=3232981 RepID=UPI003F8F628C
MIDELAFSIAMTISHHRQLVADDANDPHGRGHAVLKISLQGNSMSSTSSSLVRAGLLLLEQREQRNQLEAEALRAEIAAALSSGTPEPAEDLSARFESKYRATDKSKHR